MKNIIVFLFFALVAGNGRSQVQFGGMQQLGLSFNESGIDCHLAVVNGVRFKKYFAGLGANVALGDGNFFPWWTSCFYADGRYYLGETKRFFCKLNGGVNLITENTNDVYYYWYPQRVKKQAGVFCAAGFGYKAKLGNEVYYSFDLSFSFTQLRYTTMEENTTNAGDFRSMWPAPGPEKFDLRRNAIVLQMGLEFN